MDKRYEAYCLADPAFYDYPAPHGARNPDFAAADREPPAGWTSRPSGEWWHVAPPERRHPEQGWKVHVSATLGNAVKVLDEVWDYCTGNEIAFKFLCGPRSLFLRNSKYADRGGSGKLVTIYPADEAELERTLKELGDRLRGEPGPYILSDLRWYEGPLYVRYGGFTPRYCVDDTGALVSAIAEPDGTLVPDRRGPVFAPPAWAVLPEFLAPQLAARNAAASADLPYKVTQALHFSNGGGVYKATDTRNGEQVVLKEARPHAGLVGNGDDAVARLHHEREALDLLAGSGVAPEVRDYFTLGEHHFLALEFIEGRALNSYFAERYPLNRAQPDPEVVAQYTEWALKIQASTEHAVAVLHDRGVVFNDLHLFNIMVRPDDTVALIDFEVAVPVARSTRQILASRAFQAPADRVGFAVDRYALACLRLALFLPLTTLLALDRTRAVAMAEAIRAEFPAVPVRFLDEAVREICRDMFAAPDQTGAPDTTVADTAAAGEISAAGTTAAGTTAAGSAAAGTAAAGISAKAAGRPMRGGVNGHSFGPIRAALPAFDRGVAGWPELRESLAAGIRQAATPGRADRLFPGDIRQFTHPGGGLDLANGAAGVLYALHAVGVPIEPAHEDWLLATAIEPPANVHLGLYDGMHGVAHTLDLLGHRDAAIRVLSVAMDEQWRKLGSDLADGLSGIGLNLLHFARRTGDTGDTGDTGLRDEALAAAAIVAQRLGGAEDVPVISGGTNPRAGLMRGSSGPALLFLHLYEDTGDTSWLDLAETALRQDLRRCVTVAVAGDGRLHVNEGRRTMPYLAHGSAGIGLVLRRFLGHRPDDGLAESAAAIRKACTSRFYVQPGLFAGRAGTILALGRGGTGQGAAEQTGPGPEVLDQISRLSWHAVRHEDSLAFPGEQLSRLSTDLATGAAGVLLALGAVLHDAPVHLPFLGTGASPREQGPPSAGFPAASSTGG